MEKENRKKVFDIIKKVLKWTSFPLEFLLSVFVIKQIFDILVTKSYNEYY